MTYPENNGTPFMVEELTDEYGGKKSNWVPIHKNFIHYMPKGREYTELEAVFSYMVDLDNNSVKSERAYARIWSWSRTKVKKFLDEIAEPERGHNPYHFRATSKPPLFIINKNLWNNKIQKPAISQPEKSQSKATTYNPNPNPNPKEDKNNNGEATLPPEFDSDLFRQTLKDFVKHRKSMKGGFTAKAESLIVAKLLKLSDGDVDTAIAILEQSIMQGWKGVFELKKDAEKKDPEKGMPYV